MRWRKSSYSSDVANCVEVSHWRKSIHSSSTANCVEVRNLRKILEEAQETVGVRDSKNPDGPILAFPQAAWQSFLTS